MDRAYRPGTKTAQLLVTRALSPDACSTPHPYPFHPLRPHPHQTSHHPRAGAGATRPTAQEQQQTRHSEVGHKSMLKSTTSTGALYILETSVYPREPESMRELREATAKHPCLQEPAVPEVPPPRGAVPDR
ncbi:uncharacterized protein LOC133895113 [Phragmites australis]|uniref:uncharacterized protein LOC133895113 n=1 Tax=Phragmites australis TaxID=29695 RepID=UPI002D792A96|nr:uncharacterized protein LOC133895113 [Phragmites australis]